MKIQTIIFALIAIVLLVVDNYGFYLCNTYKCREVSDAVLLSTLIIISTCFVISVTLLFLPSSIYKSWWSFARIAIPVILIISTIINLQLHHRSGGLFNLDNIFDIPALILMYSVFIIGSLIQIYRGYYQK